MADNLTTKSYKGVRDFYPDDMAVQRYIFDTWSETAESFGYERYDASVLEPAELYKAKGAENEEMVNEQTYTFTDRGDREVTLRPEMTPTVARMIAGKAKELAFPVRWYSIPNLFRYERAQRGRLREHWQLNCDIFGSDDFTADMEIIALAHQLLLNFGAESDMFEIRINDRAWINQFVAEQGLSGDAARDFINLLDRKEKIDNFESEAKALLGKPLELPDSPAPESKLAQVIDGLRALGIENVKFSPSTVRGFDYYTGTIFEIFDVSGENNRSMLGGGRYDNLTEMFGGDPVPGVGFGMGDVTMRDFLETHNLLTADLTSPTLMIMPMDATLNLEAQKLAQIFRSNGISVATDISNRKVAKKLAAAGDHFVDYALVLGEDELSKGEYVVKNLTDGSEITGSVEAFVSSL